MKLILSSIAMLLSLSAFAQKTAPPIYNELTPAEKVAAIKVMVSLIPSAKFKGSTVGYDGTSRCTAYVGSTGEDLRTALYENKLINWNGFSEDYHPTPIEISYLSNSDVIIHHEATTKKASITSLNLKEHTTETVTIEKLEKNHALVSVSRGTLNGEQKTTIHTRGCNIDLDKKINN